MRCKCQHCAKFEKYSTWLFAQILVTPTRRSTQYEGIRLIHSAHLVQTHPKHIFLTYYNIKRICHLATRGDIYTPKFLENVVRQIFLEFLIKKYVTLAISDASVDKWSCSLKPGSPVLLGCKPCFLPYCFLFPLRFVEKQWGVGK